jgi:hypothetical protein
MGITILPDRKQILADAAPDLLRALTGLCAQIENAAAHGVDTTGYVGLGDAFHAIRKAEGRE